MSRGRPPLWNPFAGVADAPWVEVSSFDAKGRLSIPSAARRALSWLAGAPTLLAELHADGSAELMAQDPTGAARVKAIVVAAEAAPIGGRGELLLAAMDRFVQLAVEEGSRLAMPANLKAHLDPAATGRIWVVVRDARLWLWGHDSWTAARASRGQLLDDALRRHAASR